MRVKEKRFGDEVLARTVSLNARERQVMARAIELVQRMRDETPVETQANIRLGAIEALMLDMNESGWAIGVLR